VTSKARYDICLYSPWVALRVAEQSAPGGSETQVTLLARALARHGLTVCLLGGEVPGVEVPPVVGGVDFVLCGTATGGGWRGGLRQVTAVRKALKKIAPRVVVARSAGYWVGLFGLWAKVSGRHFVFASASTADFDYEKVLVKKRERLLFRIGVALADQIIVQTEEQIEPCRRRFHKTPVLIQSISEPAATTNRQREAFLWVGRAEANKQPLLYLELARALPDARFWMIAFSTDTRESEQLSAEITRAASALPNVELLAPRPRAQLLEGVPNIFLEAWAHGTPALTLNHDPDGIITRHGLGGHAEGQLNRLIDLASHHWRNRDTAHERAHHYRTYVQTQHSPTAVAAAWARALHIDDGAAPQPQTATT